jgi:16S rRNA (adenine1518-N6/adenine1519-N6)-dimethyltransferase
MYEPIKRLGQNFLIDKSVSRDMVEALEIKDGDYIVEIGPGHGSLTDILVDKLRVINARLDAVEIDERFYQKLLGMYESEEKVKIVCDDILQWLPRFHPETEFKIIGSLPYYITSPIIHGVINMRKRPTICVLLVQKEVAEKIRNKAPDSSYMSCFVQTFFEVKYLGKVSRNRFKPEPNVDGGVLKLVNKKGEVTQEFLRKYEGFLHKAFSNPRKMLNKVFTKEDLEKGKIDSTLRAQNLNAEDWLKFYQVLYEI